MEFASLEVDLVVITGDPVAFLLKEDSRSNLPKIKDCSPGDLSVLVRLACIFISVTQYLVKNNCTFQEILAVANKIKNKDVLLVAYCFLADYERKKKFNLTREEEIAICMVADRTVRK